MNYFITAIGTDSGKTVIASALALSLKADYWKPIQAGFPTDSDAVRELTEGNVHVHQEKYILNTPASPHFAAEVDNVSIKLEDFIVPPTQNNMIIEGAGGCLVPMNNEEFVINIAHHCNAEIILVSNNYLGSINHTLLTLSYLKEKKLRVKGIIFNGEPNKSTEDIILKHAETICFYKVPKFEKIDQDSVKQLSENFKQRWNELGW